MTIWFTSDHHFGHANIIKYCARPFKSVAQMDSAMAATWNSVVAPSDHVYYLGDFAISPRRVSEILGQLHGLKILIPGNHDCCYRLKSQKWIEHYLRAGFQSIEMEWRLDIAGESVLLNHLPYRNEADPSQKYFGQRPVDRGGWLIHGHVHNKWKVNTKQINVSVDVWNFEPVSLEMIAAIIVAAPNAVKPQN